MSVSQQNHVAAVQEIFGWFSEGKIDNIVNRMHENITWRLHGPTAIPWAGPRTGKGEAGLFFKAITDHADVLGFEPQQFLSDGNRVVTTGKFKFRVKSTGKTAEYPWAMFFTFGDHGKVTAYEQFFDSAAAVAAFHK